MAPDLKLVSLDTIELQEEADANRLRKLIATLEKSNLLTDPPILAKGLGKKYIQLDGANRISSLRKMDCSHVVAQIVDYHDQEQISIKSWVHTSKVVEKEFIQRLKKLKNIQIETFALGLGVTLTGHPMASATIIFRDGKGLSVYANGDLFDRVQLLNDVVDLYKKLIKRDTHISIESMSDLSTFFTRHKNMNVGLFFPTFSSQEIYSLIEKGATLPTGITRHVVNGRVLGIDYPISMLKKSISDKEKKDYFNNFKKNLKLRFYEEPVNVVE